MLKIDFKSVSFFFILRRPVWKPVWGASEVSTISSSCCSNLRCVSIREVEFWKVNKDIKSHQQCGSPSIGVPLHFNPPNVLLVVDHWVVVVPGQDWHVWGWWYEWHQKRKVGLEVALLRLQMRRSWLPCLMNTSSTLPLPGTSSSSLLPLPVSPGHTICPALFSSSHTCPPFPASTFTSANASDLIKSS